MEPFQIRVDEHTLLFLYQEKDATELFTLIDKNRSYFREWLSWIDSTKNINDSVFFIRENQLKYKSNLAFALGINYLGKIVGGISFNAIDFSHKNGTIGYMLSEDFTGRGIITQSCRALINYGFNELKLNRITIKCAVENTKSRAIPEKLGFKLEGIIEQNERLYNRFVDHAQYGMLKENWK
jgi:ribosomal-protein-serine acetyltransferase